ncbi:MAG: PAS domain S-box protein [Proteobacteria bacterium]|nr:PAS domain S-box protein [Pseudomonadota bacterium]MBU1739104.1 PAS domain S-box protein [Pseudomonadota bacterium]
MMSDKAIQGLSIFYRFLLAFLAIVISVSVSLIVVFYGYSKNTITEQTRENINQDFANLTHQFQEVIKDEITRDLKILSTNPILDSYFMATQLEKEIEARAVERLFLQSIEYSNNHRSITFVEYSGTEVIKVNRKGRIREYGNISRTKIFTELEAASPGEIIVHGPFRSMDGEHYISAGIGKPDPDIGQFGGAIIIDYSLEEFFSQLQSIKFRGTNPVWGFAPSGQPLVEPSRTESRLDPHPYFESSEPCQVKSNLDDKGMIFCKDLAIIPGQPLLRVAISIPKALLMKDIMKIVKFLLIVSLVSVVSTTLIIYAVSRYLSQPIILLAKAAARLATGDITTRVDIRSSGEIQLLVDSFNQLASDLDKTTVSKDYVDNIIKSMMDMLIVLSPGKLITRANDTACSQLGFTPEELVGQSIQRIYKPPVDDTSPGTIFDHESISSVESNFIKKSGAEVTVLLSSATLRDGDGQLQGWVLVAQDITERKIAEEVLAEKTRELGRSNAELQQFANIASHDLQEPLRKVLSFGERLNDLYGERLDEKGRDYLERMRIASYRMQQFIEDLLSFSRVTTKAKPFQKTDLNQVIAEVLSILEVRLEESGGRVESEELATIDADTFQIKQIFQNLIANALKFNRKGVPPRISISGSYLQTVEKDANSSGKYNNGIYQITIKDNGIGFENQYSERIFGIFQRLHGKNEYAGTGIGLSVCQKIVERHNGTIKAKGVPGEGATFIISLPVKQTTLK